MAQYTTWTLILNWYLQIGINGWNPNLILSDESSNLVENNRRTEISASLSSIRQAGAALDLKRMALCIEDVLVEANEWRVGEDEIEILENFGEEEAARARSK